MIMLSLAEVVRWTGVTVFEIWLHCVALLASTILLYLKLDFSGRFALSYWHVFAPLLIASVLNAYFLFIVFVRMVIEERDAKAPMVRCAFNWLRLSMVFVFEILLCYKVHGDLDDGQVAVQSSYGVVFLPIWILMSALCFQACRLL